MILIKIGGGKTINLPAIISDAALLNEPFCIIHGANALRDDIALQLESPKRVVTSVSGVSSVFSDEKAIDLLMMAYAGLRNSRIVELCHQHGINAVGLSGIDGKLIQGQRNKGIKVRQDGKTLLLHDFSGKPKSINTSLLTLLLDNGYVPIISVPIIDEHNQAINTENDDIVNVFQSSMHCQTIIQLIEAPGFLADKDSEASLVKKISPKELTVRADQVDGRMKRKMMALVKLFEDDAQRVIISDGRIEKPITAALKGHGTLIENIS